MSDNPNLDRFPYRTVNTPPDAVTAVDNWFARYANNPPWMEWHHTEPDRYVVMLSSGTDSMSLVALMKRHFGEKVSAVVAGSPGEGEAEKVLSVCNAIGVDCAVADVGVLWSEEGVHLVKDISQRVNSGELWTVGSGLLYRLTSDAIVNHFPDDPDSIVVLSGAGADTMLGDGFLPTPTVLEDPVGATAWLDSFQRSHRTEFLRRRDTLGDSPEVDSGYPRSVGGFPVWTPYASDSFAELCGTFTAQAVFDTTLGILGAKEPLRRIAARDGWLGREPRNDPQRSSGIIEGLGYAGRRWLSMQPGESKWYDVDTEPWIDTAARLAVHIIANR